MVFDLFFCGLFLVILFYFGLRKTQGVQSEDQYLVADRNSSTFALMATLVMTEFNTATLISFSSLGYLAGFWALTLPCVFLIGLLFYALAVAKKWKAFNGLSVASFFSLRFGKDIGLLASGALLLAMTGFSAAYVKSLYLLFTPFFPLVSPWLLSGVLVACVALLMARGGLISIIRTDVVGFFVAVFFFPCLAFFSYNTSIEQTPITQPLVILPPRLVISFILLTMFTYILAPWYGQKIFAARTERTAYVSVLLAALFVFVLYALAVLSTVFFRRNGGVVPSAEQALPFVIAQVLPIGLRGLGFGILFAASATTLTGVWSAMTTLLVGDFLGRAKTPPLKAVSYKRSMLITLAFALSSFLLANLLVDRVFDKLVLANIPIAALSFALLAGFYWKKTSRTGVYLSLFVGWFIGVYTYLHFGEAGIYTWYWALWGIPAIFISGIIGSILCPNKKVIIIPK